MPIRLTTRLRGPLCGDAPVLGTSVAGLDPVPQVALVPVTTSRPCTGRLLLADDVFARERSDVACVLRRGGTAPSSAATSGAERPRVGGT
ncbi:hypothetical protein DQ237_17490 [Blastococcus sp. TF02-8]|nr:hypothetical protein DQ237_17490 [Blastococcus sp. TF02-8]